MIGQTLAIIHNTFFESIRQPIVLVLLVAYSLAMVLTAPLSAFTMSDDQRMLVDLGLATIFLVGALLAALIATNVLNREIANRTVLTVVSKPVARPLFVLGKFTGVAGAILLSTAYMAFGFMLVERHGVIQTVRDPVHAPTVLFGVLALVIGVGAGVWCNYFYGKVFSSTTIMITTPLLGLAYVFSLMFGPDFSPQPIALAFKGHVWLAVASLAVAILVLTAIAIAASTRLGQIMTLVVTIGLFVLGMLSDWLFGRRIDGLERSWLERARLAGRTTTESVTRRIELVSGEVSTTEDVREVATVPLVQMAEGWEQAEYALCWAGYAALPNFQLLWLSDAVTQGHVIPGSYVAGTLVYGALYSTAALALAIVLFQRREVG